MIVNIIGNIGSGKTTILDKLKGFGHVIYEPVNEWRNSNMLQSFYENMEYNAGAFQYYVKTNRFLDKLKKIREIYISDWNETPIIFCERGWYEDDIFLTNLWNEKLISDIEKTAILEFNKLIDYELETFINKHFTTYDIKLSCTLDTMLDRIKQRGRPEELVIDKEYLEGIEKLYASMCDPDYCIINDTRFVDDTVQLIKNIVKKEALSLAKENTI